MKENNHLIEMIKNISIFSPIACDEEIIKKLANCLIEKEFKKGDVIIKEGEIGTSLYIIYSGSVRITKQTTYKDSYTVVILKDHENIFFGEICLLEDSVRTANVICEEDSIFYILQRDDFNRLCSENFRFGYYVLKSLSKILADRLKKSNEDIMILFNALLHEIED